MNLTEITLNDFNEYDIFGTFNLDIQIRREPYMREKGWEQLTEGIITAIQEYFYNYYISYHPYVKWVRFFTSRLNRSVRKYYPQLMLLYSDDEEINILDGGEVGHKNKKVNSQFPQTMIQESEAYASDASDDVGREVKTLGAIEASRAANDPDNPYENVINYILNDVSVCFSTLDF